MKTRFGRCIYDSPGGARVYQNPFYRWLTFSNSDAIQSLINIKQPEKPVLNYLIALCALAKYHPGATCMLGVGGLAAAHYLSSSMKEFQMIAVDNDAEVIDIAQRYFMADSLKNLNIIHEDAQTYIKHSKHQFRHIIVDLYEKNSFPQQCNHDEFFKDCYEHLEPQGFLEINLANPEEREDIFNKIQKQFKHSTLLIPVKGSANTIILACKTNSFSYLIEQLQQNVKIKHLFWDPIWGSIAELA